MRSFTSPSGMCFALPRYSDGSLTTVDLDGVICLSRTTSKVCFWDNQMSGTGFSFASGTKIPIGVVDLVLNPAGQYQAGGFELNNGTGGPCTNCHAGENPYIIHPKTNLGSQLWGALKGPPQNLPTFGPARYDPLVPSAWWQNASSHAAALVPGQCGACHVQGDAGRFPHLSTDTGDYCNTILQQAIKLREQALAAARWDRRRRGIPALGPVQLYHRPAPLCRRRGVPGLQRPGGRRRGNVGYRAHR